MTEPKATGPATRWRSWSSQIGDLKRLKAQGCSNAAIAAILDRSVGAIATKLHTLQHPREKTPRAHPPTADRRRSPADLDDPDLMAAIEYLNGRGTVMVKIEGTWRNGRDIFGRGAILHLSRGAGWRAPAKPETIS